jgi:hypothetical protein
MPAAVLTGQPASSAKHRYYTLFDPHPLACIYGFGPSDGIAFIDIMSLAYYNRKRTGYKEG